MYMTRMLASRALPRTARPTAAVAVAATQGQRAVAIRFMSQSAAKAADEAAWTETNETESQADVRADATAPVKPDQQLVKETERVLRRKDELARADEAKGAHNPTESEADIRADNS